MSRKCMVVGSNLRRGNLVVEPTEAIGWPVLLKERNRLVTMMMISGVALALNSLASRRTIKKRKKSSWQA